MSMNQFNQPRESDARKRSKSPILDQVLRGGSSVSFNVLQKTSEIGEAGDKFFRRRTLNETIIFKYPNFDIEIAELQTFDFGAGSKLAQISKPIETAIFIPIDTAKLEDGGNAVYMRQHKFQDLLYHYFGIDLSQKEEEEDIKKLRIIDCCPTLDPFLMRATLEREDIRVNPHYFAISKAEEREVKKRIEQKIAPIIEYAFSKTGAAQSDTRAERFVDAIWDPTMSEASLFIAAFGLKEEQIEGVMNGWKGVSYYQYLFGRNARDLKMILDWFRSPYSRPSDASAYKLYMEGLEMHKKKVFTHLERLIRNVAEVFADYDAAYTRFLDDNDPRPLRDFYMTAESRYWVLGFTCSALFHSVNLVKRATRGHPHNRVSFDEMSDLYARMQATLSSRKPNDLPRAAAAP